MGLELDGIWTKKRFAWAVVGLLVGIFVYFIAKSFVLLPGKAGDGKWLVPVLSWLDNPDMQVGRLNAALAAIGTGIRSFLPIPWLILAGIVALNMSLANKRKPPLIRIPGAKWMLGLGALLFYINWIAPTTFTIDPAQAGPGPYYLPGFSWLFALVPSYFANLGGLYYLCLLYTSDAADE